LRTRTKAQRVATVSGNPLRLRRAIDRALIFRAMMNKSTPPLTRMTTMVVNTVTTTVRTTCSTDIRPKYSEYIRHQSCRPDVKLRLRRDREAGQGRDRRKIENMKRL
jgi:hypothetical protein